MIVGPLLQAKVGLPHAASHRDGEARSLDLVVHVGAADEGVVVRVGAACGGVPIATEKKTTIFTATFVQ